MPLPPKVLQQGHHRHGPHQRRAHERHRLRHRGAAHRARGGRRRPARAGAQRRLDRARRAEAPPAPDISDDELGAPLPSWTAAGAAARTAATGSSTSTTCCRPTRARTSTSWSASAARSCRGPTSPSPTIKRAARSCRATTTDRSRPRVHGGGRRWTTASRTSLTGGARRFRPRQRALRFQRSSGHWTARRHDVLEAQRPSPFSPPASATISVSAVAATVRRRSRRAAAAAPRVRCPAARAGYAWAPGHWDWTRPTPRLGERPLGARASRLRVPRSPRWVQDGDRWRLHARRDGLRGDRDRDGVPNRLRRAIPDNPRRP